MARAVPVSNFRETSRSLDCRACVLACVSEFLLPKRVDCFPAFFPGMRMRTAVAFPVCADRFKAVRLVVDTLEVDGEGFVALLSRSLQFASHEILE